MFLVFNVVMLSYWLLSQPLWKNNGYHFESALYQEAWRVSAASWAFLLVRARYHVHSSQVAWSPIFIISRYLRLNSHFEHRSMTIKTLEDFVEYMRTYMVSRVKTMVTWSHVSHFCVWFIHNGKCIHWDIWLSKILQILAEIPGEGNVKLRQFCLLIFMRIS